MKIVVISSLYRRPGKLTGEVVHRQCLELMRGGLSVSVICPIPRGRRDLSATEALKALFRRPKVETIDGLDVWYVPYFNVPHGISAQLDARVLTKAIWGIVERAAFQVDLIHAHRLFPTAYASHHVTARLGIPLVATVHGSDIHTNPERNPGIASCTIEVLNAANSVTTVSAALAADVRAFTSGTCHPEVTYLGVDTDEFRPKNEKGETRRRLGLPELGVGICSVSRLVSDKGVHDLIDAFERLQRTDREDRESWLVLVGDGPARDDLEKQIRKLGLERQVFLPGAQPHSDVHEWLNAADVFLLASRKEGLPNSILEAMSCGLPIVATDVGGVAEAVTGECGILVPPRQVSSLYEAMYKMVMSSNLRHSMGNESRKRAKRVFSWSASAENLIRVYESVRKD